MSYRHTWLLVDDMNNGFLDPVVAAQPAGAHGGGAILTAFGQQLVERYRPIEVEAQEATRNHLQGLEAALKGPKARRAPTSLKRPVRASAGRR
jgi:molybdate transport system regulatory protein